VDLRDGRYFARQGMEALGNYFTRSEIMRE
jgi:hypothetical protein